MSREQQLLRGVDVTAWVPRIALVVLTAGIVAGIVSISVGEGGPQPHEVEGTYDVQRIFAGIDQEQADLGKQDSEITLTVFTDLQCSPCAPYHLDVIEPLVEDYARPGEALLELRHFSMSRDNTTLAAIAATAAAQQGRQWQYAGLFFRNQDLVDQRGVTEELLREIAGAMLGFEMSEWEEALDDPATAERVEADTVLSAELRLPAQPAVIVTGPGGQRELVDSPSREEIEEAIAEVG